MIYLFLGQQQDEKSRELKKIKESHLGQSQADFNLDLFYGRELSLSVLQERLLALPVKSAKRITVIRQAQDLKEDLQDFLLKYSLQPYPTNVLVLDFSRVEPKDSFIAEISRHAKVCRFKQAAAEPDTFALKDYIEERKTQPALQALNQLLDSGKKPEMILGALRALWERQGLATPRQQKRIKALLVCDIDIKTGRLKPDLALERLVIGLCGIARG